MAKIIGNTTMTPVPRSDWNQVDETKADFILNKPDVALATHTHSDYETKVDADKKFADANQYTDEKIALLLNNSSEAVDSIMELAAAMEANESVVDALEAAIGGKADAEHDHDDRYYTEAEIDSKLETKADVSAIPSIEGLAMATYVDSQDAAMLAEAKFYTDTQIGGIEMPSIIIREW